MNTKKILLVEDEALIAMSQISILEKHGFQADAAYTGEDGVKSIEEDPSIDLVLMDIDLGSGLDGIGAAKAILDRRELPIVFLTNHGEKEAVEKVKTVTRYGYVLKSAGEFVLIESINMAFELFEAHKKSQKHEKELLENRNFLEGILDSIQDGISVLNEDLTIRFTNRVIEEWCPEEKSLVGKKCHEVYHKANTPCNPCPTLRALRSGRTEYDIVPGPPGSSIECTEIYSYPYKNRVTEEIEGVIEFVRDITERKKMENALVSSNKSLRTVLDSIPADVYISDMETYEVLYMNEQMRRSFGGDYVGQICWKVFRNNTAPCPHCSNPRLLDEKGEPAETIVWEDYNPVNGKWYINYDRAIPWPDGRYVRIQIASEITERKKAENEVRRLLEEKQVILKEVHHRIKNHMNLISSILSLQSSTLTNAEAVQALEEAQSRIDIMQNIYNSLYTGGTGQDDYRVLDIRDYLKEMLFELQQMYSENVHVNLESDIKHIEVPIRYAFPIGIIVNELVTNAYKYAFPEGRGGTIYAAVMLTEEKGIKITVSDDGVGIPADLLGEGRKGDAHGFGLSLIHALTEQHDGTFEFKRKQERGSSFSITFPPQPFGQE
jgi:two-component sensor histidine kinase/CheY-like chemotaxis protein